MKRFLIIEACGNVASNPTIMALIDELLVRGHGVDLLTPEGTLDSFRRPQRWSQGVEVRAFLPEFGHGDLDVGLGLRVGRKLKRIVKSFRSGRLSDPLAVERRRARQQTCILGVDPLGIIAAHRVNQTAKRGLAYLSFELLLNHELESDAEKNMKRRESAAIKETGLFLLQDEQRCRLFCEDNGVARQQCVLVPVAPPDQRPAKTDFLHRRLGVAADTRLVLYQGSLSAWGGRDEFEELVSYWPEDVKLVVHSRHQVQRRMRNYLDAISASGRILFSDHPVSADELPMLTASADIGLAGYRPDPDHWTHGENLRSIGLASGKIAYYAMCGLPILARYQPSLAPIIEGHHIGRCYKRLSETGDLIREILENQAQLGNHSRDFYLQQLAPAQHIGPFCDALEALAESPS